MGGGTPGSQVLSGFGGIQRTRAVTIRYTIHLPEKEASIPMLWNKSFSWLLLSAALALSGAIRADDDKQLSPAAQDRTFENMGYLLLDQEAGAAARYVRLTRFKNTILITGEVENSSHASVIDALVLDAAGIKRETPAGTTVVPKKHRECGGKPVTGNVKRQQIVKADRDCSSLQSDASGQSRGRVYNHLSVAAPDPSMKLAQSNLLLAETALELVEAGHPEVMDRSVMRMVAQDGVLYILGSVDETGRARIRAMLMALPGVRDVRFYAE